MCTLNNLAPTSTQGCGFANAEQVNNSGTVEVENGVVQFPMSSIPFDSEVTQATLTLGGSDYGPNTDLQVQSLGQAYDPNTTTWNNASSSTAWTVSGGTPATTPPPAVYSATPTAASASSWTYYPTQLVQQWVSNQANNGAGAPDDGFLLSENTAPAYGTGISYNISSASLLVSYYPRLGLSSAYKYDSHRLNDRSTLYVQTANQNGVVDAKDLNIRGTGLALGVNRTYNTLNQSWSFSVGQDDTIQSSTNPLNPVEQTPTGAVQTYTPSTVGTCNFMLAGASQSWPVSYTATAGGDGNLCKNPSVANQWALQSHSSGEVLVFGDGAYASTGATLTGFSVRSLLTQDIDHNGNTITYTYASNNTLSGITDTQGRAFTVTASPGGHIASIAGPTGSAQSRTWTYNWDTTTGLLDSYTDATGGVTSYTYNSSGVLDEIQTPGILAGTRDVASETDIGLSGNTVTSLTQKDSGCVAGGPSSAGLCVTDYTQVRPASTACTSYGANAPSQAGCATVTDANGHTTSYGFDDMDRTLKAIDGNNHAVATSYNPDSQVATTTDAVSSAVTTFNYHGGPTGTQDQVSSASSPTGAQSGFNYTSGGNSYQPAAANDSQSNCSSLSYDTSSATSYGNVTSISAGMTSSSATGGCGSAGSATALTKTNYQSAGTGGTTQCGAPNHPGVVCSTVDPNSNTTSYTYDANGNPTGSTPPGSANTGSAATAGSTLKASSQTVDGLSRVATTTDANGNVTAYWYDNNDRLTQAVYAFTGTYNPVAPPACSTYTNCTTYTYDPDGNLSSRTDVTGTTTYTYSHLDRLLNEVPPSTAQPGCSSTTNDKMTYTYDNVGNTISSCTDARTTRFTYDNANELLAASSDTGFSCPAYSTGVPVNCVTFSYDADHHRTGTAYPGGVTQAVTYDPSGRVTGVTTTGITSQATGVTPLVNDTYGYTKPGAGDTNLVWTSNGGTYTYDSLNRLTNASVGGHTWTYTYDSFGNRLTSREDTGATTYYAYNTASELCWTYATTTTLTSPTCASPPAGATTYTYDHNGNQLTGPVAGAALTASYNNKDETSQTVGAATYTYTYADLDQTQRSAGDGTNFDNSPQGVTLAGTVDYIRSPNGTLLWMQPSSGNRYYYLYDGHGNVVGLINTTQQLVDSYTYDPYGATTATETVTQPFRYAAGYQDPTGLYHYGARYYDPTTGRFTQTDPTGANPGYIYAGDNPINNSDPTGTDIFNDILGGASTTLSVTGDILDAAGAPEVGGFFDAASVVTSGANATYSCATESSEECSTAATSFGIDAGTFGIGQGLDAIGAPSELTGAVGAATSAYDVTDYVSSF
jgi:RHS repeat-associated protein